ncbi:thioredoxin [Sporobacter termitidis DSM 10068]|uniref:Thioredoxin n=1 Tax=Sporobacter termitidis DSM 10068 TaxID=1123282 RepID=A0A1M5VK45_9FIRM|nr:thioredoxin [Sporobacter termitidis]SHH75601.1 thioredoxin [Sporobacter termitidis DSM 10068]
MEILHLTKNDFNDVIASGTVLVDFWAGWCMPCKMLAPVIEELAEELKDSVKTGKVDVDAEGELAAEYGVMSIPTVIVFRNGQEAKRFVGVQPKEVYTNFLAPEKAAASGAEAANTGEEE